MSSIAIVVVAYFFGLMSVLIDHAWLVVPVAVVAWGLLFVPTRVWKSAIVRLRRLFGRAARGRGTAHLGTVPARITPSHSR